LRELQAASRDEFVGNGFLSSTGERQLPVAIQSAIDIGQYILSSKGIAGAREYPDVFAQLGETGVLPVPFAARMAEMARFRNVLVYLNAKVDLDRVYSYIQDDLGDFETFANHVVAYLDRECQDAKAAAILPEK
jgi:uncharacterized protein YutE (UPF0331/DUF86 family)